MGTHSTSAIQELLSLYGARQFQEMERRAVALLKGARDSAILNELTGLALMAQERFREAEPYLKKAAEGTKDDPTFWDNLALCQRQLGSYSLAEESVQHSLRLRPQSPETLNILGSILRSLDRLGEAAAVLEQAQKLTPKHPGILFNLGKTYVDLDRLPQAEMCLNRAVAIAPRLAAAHNQLGLVHQRRNERIKAEAAFRRALVLEPNSQEALVNLAFALQQCGQRSEAKSIAGRALNLLAPIERSGADDAAVRDRLSEIFEIFGEAATAARLSREAFHLDPDPARALRACFHSRSICDWANLDFLELAACAPVNPSNERRSPWHLLSVGRASPQLQLEVAASLARNAERKATPIKRRPRRPNARLRLAYCSSDLRDHPVGHLLAGVIEHHNRELFDILAYDTQGAQDDAYRFRLINACDRFVSLGDLSDPEAARQIAEDAIDIVIDLNGWTRGARNILSFRPAHLQIQWLGYPGSMGASWIDYIIADSVLILPEDERCFSEKILRLPSYQPNDDKRVVSEARTRDIDRLPAEAFVFACFNQSYKITPDIFAVWMQLLSAVEKSVLWLSVTHSDAISALQKKATELGVDSNRLIFAPRLKEIADHRARLSHADLALDCFPYGAHTTASDLLHAGVPLIALRGSTLASRVSASVLQSAGLPQLVTASLGEYRDLALRLAGNPEEMAELRATVKGSVRRSRLFDTRAFAVALEGALLGAWDRESI